MTSRRAWTLTAAGALLWLGATTGRVLGADPPAGRWPAEPPRLLSQTGLYGEGTPLVVDPRNRPFAPQYPLWSDGAAKRRWVRLPDGAPIGVARIDHWDFPVGTRFWKEFTFAGRKVETRLLWKTGTDGWRFASYAWRDDQRDAVLAPAGGIADAAEVAPGKWHSIPSLDECRACHDSARTEVLGFTALQLSEDRDPLAPHAEPLDAGMLTLRTLVAENRLTPPRPELVAAPPRIEAVDGRERAVLGYLSTNCGSCHNRQSSIASLGLFLKYTLETAGACAPDALTTTVDRPGHWLVPTAPAGTSRLLQPGRPELSALLHRARSRRPSSQMPPIGTVVADRQAIELLTAWIEGGGGTAAMSACGPRTSH